MSYSDYLEKIYYIMLLDMGHGHMRLFPTGRHPAMLSNRDEFCQLSIEFLKG